MLDRARDYTSKAGAEALADTITKFWSARGKVVNVYVYQEPLPRGTMPIFNVRSRMQGGRP